MALLGRTPERYSNLLQDTYEETIYESYDLAEIISLLEQVNFENAKIVISGKDLLESEILEKESVLSDVLKEKYMKTKY